MFDEKFVEKHREAYSNIDSDTREMIDVMTGVRISEGNKTVENGKERYNMIKAFEDYRLEGKMEGKIEGKIESILELLEDLGQVPQRIVEHIKEENDPDILRRWHKSAAKAASIAEFEANM